MFRIGARPSRDRLSSGDSLEANPGDLWSGSSITEEQLDNARAVLMQTVDEVGGKVCEASYDRRCF